MLKKIQINGFTLKIIAMVSMLIDHIDSIVLRRTYSSLFAKQGYIVASELPKSALFALNIKPYVNVIGRLAFPVFAFLIVEGFIHTSNVKKYALRLGAFALISEIPYDIAFHDRVFYYGNQNVFFTLFVGLIVLIILKKISENILWELKEKALTSAVVIAVGMGVAFLLRGDYVFIGVLAIALMYLARSRKWLQCLCGAASLGVTVWAPLAFIPIWFYNGKRGKNIKYFFYYFYPGHLLLLLLVAYILGLPCPISLI